METSFLELRCKEVIENESGKRLGRVNDIVFSYPQGRVLGIVLPGEKSGFFKPCEDVFIKFRNICKIGDDVILVSFKDRNSAHHDKEHCFDTRPDCCNPCHDNRDDCHNPCEDRRNCDNRRKFDCDDDE